LSDRQKFPFFFRTVAVESAHNAARLAFLRHFRWDSVSFLVQNEDDYSLVNTKVSRHFVIYLAGLLLYI
jgi:gamma-aminobutyric acid type B receptor